MPMIHSVDISGTGVAPVTASTEGDALRWSTAGQVPVVWRQSPGPITAAVGFRVGRVDEPLARAGLAHLVEHLVLSGLGERLYGYNGMVRPTTTWFGVRGTQIEVAEFFGYLCAAIADPPLDRLPTEVGVLRAEDARRSGSLVTQALTGRFGTVGWGALGLSEYGLGLFTPDDVVGALSRWFGTANCAAWATGALPDDLALRFTNGPRASEPPVVALDDRPFPGWLRHQGARAAVAYVAPRSSEAAALWPIVRARLVHSLRTIDGTAYEVSLHMEHLDATSSHIVLSADGPPQGFVDAVIRVTDDLQANGPTEQEIAYQRDLLARSYQDPASVPAQLDAAASARLLGWDYVPSAQHLARLGVATPQSFAASLRATAASALFLLPTGTTINASRAAPHDHRGAQPITGGRSLRPLRTNPKNPRRRLLVGSEGVTVTGNDTSTVRTAETTVALAWSNGARALIGRDGSIVRIDPTVWPGVGKAIPQLDAALPAGVVVPSGERPPWAAKRRNPLAYSGSTSILLFGAAALWLLSVIMWVGVFSSGKDANHNPLGPLLFTAFAVAVTFAAKERLAPFFSRRRRQTTPSSASG